EVRDVQEVPNVPDKVQPVKKELDTAKMLIDQLTTKFEPDKYKDEYRTALLDLIEEKKNKEQTTTVTPEGKPGPEYEANLMDALQASLDRAKKDNPQSKSKKTPKAKKTTTKKKATTK